MGRDKILINTSLQHTPHVKRSKKLVIFFEIKKLPFSQQNLDACSPKAARLGATEKHSGAIVMRLSSQNNEKQWAFTCEHLRKHSANQDGTGSKKMVTLSLVIPDLCKLIHTFIFGTVFLFGRVGWDGEMWVGVVPLCRCFLFFGCCVGVAWRCFVSLIGSPSRSASMSLEKQSRVGLETFLDRL